MLMARCCTFKSGAIIGFAVYGVPRDVAVTWAIGYHVLSFIPITVIGLWYFARMGLRVRDLRTAEEGGQSRSGEGK